jgi:drug/metabolite transporter (DMT)-like permease
VTEQTAYWIFGFVLGGGIAIAVGKSFVDEHGRKAIPPIAAAALLLGASLGWALNAYIDYVRFSATAR